MYSIFRGTSYPGSGDTLWIIDSSLSMGIEDMSPSEKNQIESRFSTAKSIIEEGIMKIPGRHGIIVYADSAGIASPLSQDLDHLREVTKGLTIVDVYGGSDLGSALSLVQSVYLSNSISPHIIILTDGGLSPSIPLPDLPSDTRITLLALGSESGGKIPLGYNAAWERRYKYYEGKQIIVPLEKENIEKIQEKYDTALFMISSKDTALIFQSGKNTPLFSPDIWRILGIVVTILWFLIHPYVQRKK